MSFYPQLVPERRPPQQHHYALTADKFQPAFPRHSRPMTEAVKRFPGGHDSSDGTYYTSRSTNAGSPDMQYRPIQGGGRDFRGRGGSDASRNSRGGGGGYHRGALRGGRGGAGDVKSDSHHFRTNHPDMSMQNNHSGGGGNLERGIGLQNSRFRTNHMELQSRGMEGRGHWDSSRQSMHGIRMSSTWNPVAGSDPGSSLLPPPNWSTQVLPPIVPTEDYEEHPEVAALSSAEVQRLYREMEVIVTGTSPPRPIMELHQAPFPHWIVDIMYQIGFTRPYPVQAVGWPAALQSRDMVGIAKTGSGKTLAYLLPGIVHIQKQAPLRPGDGPIALVLAPTRELAMQIEREAKRFALPSTALSVICVYGGMPRSRQAAGLSRGVHICIATPGRLLDFLDTRTTNLRRVTYLVLDEADRMLDMGFEPQIRRVVSQIRPDRQTLMWSATWPSAIQQLARDLCRAAPIRVTVGSHELQANENIRQIVEVCGSQERFARMLAHLRSILRPPGLDPEMLQQQRRKALIFCETKRSCDVLCDRIRRYCASGADFYATTIHGDKEQAERDRALHDFKQGRCDVLVATDVASRGLDIKGIDLVINYDIPKTIECYIHRIGRTGRAGAVGTAVSLLSDAVTETERSRMAKEIATVMRDVGQNPPVELMELAADRNGGNFGMRQRGFGRGGRGGGGGAGRFRGGLDHFGNRMGGGRAPR